jgi:hypothetical protein
MQPSDHDRPAEDEWGLAPRILSPESFAGLRVALSPPPLIAEHWFWRGARSPARPVFDDGDEHEEYLRTGTMTGDRSS